MRVDYDYDGDGVANKDDADDDNDGVPNYLDKCPSTAEGVVVKDDGCEKTLTEAQREKMRELSSVREPFRGERVWKTAKGDWFIVDEVVGKHEMVKYALAINADGTIKGIEIMEYVESYGYEVGEASWRNQFVGKTTDATMKLNKDIKNIAGATLSCKHLTDGAKRLMVMHDLVLKVNK